MYNDVEIEMPEIGDWAREFERLPYCLKYYSSLFNMRTEKAVKDALKGFFALCTHIDFFIRSIIGTLREEKVLDNTIIAFTSDHGDMLGTHNLWAKNLFYEGSAQIPLIIVPTEDCKAFQPGTTDDRLVELRDLMPTLLEMTGLPIPRSVEGMSLVNPANNREYVYGEIWEDDRATRMIRTKKYKLIYYAVGNRFQLFDMEEDPKEMHDLSAELAYGGVLKELKDRLVSCLYGDDLSWLEKGSLKGLPDREFKLKPSQQNVGILKNRDLLLQRGIR
jgi:arylsulfatase A-like enzyme